MPYTIAYHYFKPSPTRIVKLKDVLTLLCYAYLHS
jgi:hypothetical protein